MLGGIRCAAALLCIFSSSVAFSLIKVEKTSRSKRSQDLGARAVRQYSVNSKTFRLPPWFKPAKHRFRLRIDAAAKRITGSAEIFGALGKPTKEIPLHAIDLAIGKASVHIGGRTVQAKVVKNPRSETVSLILAEEIAPGDFQIDVDWSAQIGSGLRGIYISEGVVSTHFEEADARRVFPWLGDEPDAKGEVELSIEVPKGHRVISNGEVVRVRSVGNFERTDFKPIPKMASYLAAVVTGSKDKLYPSRPLYVGKTAIRTWAYRSERHLTRFAQLAGQKSLAWYEKYFDFPYPFAKHDQVGIPGFQFGAMEHWAAVFYRKARLLQDPATAPIDSIKDVAEVVAHENAHQWFGNLVTMKWWNDLWLNESFATWISHKMIDAWKPEWHMGLRFKIRREDGFALDALEATHAIHGLVRNARESEQRVDGVTYEKGAGFLDMMEKWVGEEAFQKGLQTYISRHQYGNAEADDLWKAIQEAAQDKPVLRVANRWIRKSGFPLVEVSHQGGKLQLRQTRFFASPGKHEDGAWPIPMIIRYQDVQGHLHEERILFDRAQATLPLTGEPVRWLTANAEWSGFYHVAYDQKLNQQLLDHAGELDPADRMELLHDTWALARSGRRSVSDYLDIVARLAEDADPEVLGEMSSGLGDLVQHFLADEDRPAFERWATGLFGSRLEQLGWSAPPGGTETDQTRQTRAELLALVGGLARDPHWQGEARPRLERLWKGDKKALDPNVVPIAIRLAARDGDAALFEEYLRRSKTEVDPLRKRSYLVGLARFESSKLASRAQELLFGGNDDVPQQDLDFYVAALLENPIARGPFWQRFQVEWPRLTQLLEGAPQITRRIIGHLDSLGSPQALEQARDLLKKVPPKDTELAIRQSLERIRIKAEGQARMPRAIGAWLDRRSASF